MFLSKTTINILLFLAFIILGVAIWLGQAKNNAAVNANNIISGIKPEKITKLSISQANGSRTKLERQSGRWFMTHPIKIEANAFLANKVTKILNRRYSKKFTPNEQQLQQFGLSPALFTLQLNEYELLFGERSEISNLRYISFKNSVFLIRDQLLPVLNSAPASFISHKLIPNGARITSLELPDFSIRQHENKWLISSAPTQAATLSQDLFVKFIDEWRLSQALYISLDSGNSSIEKPASVIQLADGSRIRIIILKKESGLVFYRPDPGVYYHMHNDTEQNLLKLPEPETELKPTP